MRILFKLGIGFWTVALLVVVVGWFSFYTIKQVATTYSGLSEEFYEEVDAAIEAQSYAKRAEGHLALYFVGRNEADREKFFKRHKSLQDQITILERVVTTVGGIEQVKKLKSASDDMLRHGNQLLEASDSNPEAFDPRDHAGLFRELNDDTSTLRRTAVEIAKRRTQDAAVEASSYAKRAEGHLFLYLIAGDEADRKKFFKRHKSLKDEIAILELALKSQPEKLAALESASDDMLGVGNQLLKAYDGNPEAFDPRDHAELFRKLNDAASAARRIGVEIAKQEATVSRGNVEKAREKVASLLRNIIITLVFAILLAIGLGIFTSRSIIQPIREFRNAAAEVAKGNLDKKVNVTSKDELGELADTFNEMTHKLKESQDQLVRQEKLAAVGQLASSIGHELRNPIGVIGNSAYYLNMKLKDADEKVMKHLNILQSEVKRANTIITDLLDFSRASTPSLEKADVNSIVQNALDSTRLPENIALETRFDETLSEISADPAQIQQMFLNIISNAVQAMPEGGNLEISTRTREDFCEIMFKDTGRGIPEEDIPKIFEPLFTTKAKGIGLGLAIVKGIVDRHKGMIEVESEAGKGTTFTVKLPVTAKKGGE